MLGVCVVGEVEMYFQKDCQHNLEAQQQSIEQFGEHCADCVASGTHLLKIPESDAFQ